MIDFEKGYEAACEDFEKAMAIAAKTIMSPDGITSYNDPATFIKEMRKLRHNRFAPNEPLE